MCRTMLRYFTCVVRDWNVGVNCNVRDDTSHKLTAVFRIPKFPSYVQGLSDKEPQVFLREEKCESLHECKLKM